MARSRLLRLVNVRSPLAIRQALDVELAAARRASTTLDDGWRHLERAHILSQPWAYQHLRVHVAMLRRGWCERDRTEVGGQLIRLLVAGPGSLINRYPAGNTGRARVPATQPMPIGDEDITRLLIEADQRLA